ncbi:MAG: zinc ribbon domain-containing protein [Chloroflexi bacterium]|nr:zinc ribbon domain-containing protein [Chloroflexota bacterium]
MRQRIRWLGLWLGLLGGLLGWSAGPARAQTAVEHMPLVQVALWPEYDRPEMLVMYIIHLPEDVTLPTEVAVRIPAAVQAPSAVAVRTPEGRLLNAAYRMEADPSSAAWRLAVVEATEPILHLEFYDALQVDGTTRRYVYRWPGNWTVDNLSVEVQHPLASVAIEITPEPTRIEERDDGLRYSIVEFGALPAGREVTVEVVYENPTGELTRSPMQIPEAEPTLEIATPEVKEVPRWTEFLWPWVLAGVGILLLLLAFWLYWRGNQRPLPRATGAPRRGGPAADTRPVAGDEIRYCPQCGTRARPGDRFCRLCGTPLR